MRHLQSTWRSRVVGSHSSGTTSRIQLARNQYTTDGAFGLNIPNNKDACHSRSGYVVPMEPGKMLVLTTRTSIEVRNDSNECRAILLMRFWHPNLAVPETIEVSFAHLMQRRRRLGRYNRRSAILYERYRQRQSKFTGESVRSRYGTHTRAICRRDSKRFCIVERRAGGGDDYILSVPVVKSLKHSIVRHNNMWHSNFTYEHYYLHFELVSLDSLPARIKKQTQLQQQKNESARKVCIEQDCESRNATDSQAGSLNYKNYRSAS
jgi:hypothetical protein